NPSGPIGAQDVERIDGEDLLESDDRASGHAGHNDVVDKEAETELGVEVLNSEWCN
ncbi:hypothetical protein FOXYS1_8008, partial [Fusarium oxysporum]